MTPQFVDARLTLARTDVPVDGQPLPALPAQLQPLRPPRPPDVAARQAAHIPATAPTLLHDLLLQAAHRARQAQLRAQTEAQALQARNAHD